MDEIWAKSEKWGNRRTAFKVKPYGSVWCRTVSYGTEEETEPETEPETDADADGEAKREKQVFL